MVAVRHVVYLHGFASSPASSKAVRFGRELAARGVGFSCPDLNEPDFRALTVSRMLSQTRKLVASAASPVALVGSSLGAFVAVHAADLDLTGRIDRLVLLAPALDFGGNRLRQLGEHGIAEWRDRGSIEVFHYARNQPLEVGYTLYEDAARYDALTVRLSQPVLAFQGRRDASVDPGMVEQWASTRPNVTLRLLDDDHKLAASVDTIWDECERFFGLTP
jgi:pimeloyl-ACP methyl ester carboxylesterase